MNRFPSFRHATRRSTKRRRMLVIERLESRAVMTHDIVSGIGVIGDGLSDEYADTSFSYAKSWSELLVAARSLNLGSNGAWGEPRRAGYEFVWAREGADSSELASQGQVTGLISQITTDKVSHLVLAAGSEDFALDSPAYAGIYNGQWSQTQIDQHVASVLANLDAAVSPLIFSGKQVVVLNLFDAGLTPDGRGRFPDPVKRDAVAAVIRRVNSELATMAAQRKFALVDLAGLSNRVLGSHFTPLSSLSIGGVSYSNSAGTAPSNLFVADGLHPHTAFQTLIANSILHAFNVAYGNSFQKFSEADTLSQTGASYSGVDSLNLPYSDFVILPYVTVFLDYGTSGNDFSTRTSELTTRLGVSSPTAAEITTLQSTIENGLRDAFDGINVRFVTTRPTTGAFETIAFHLRQGQVPGSLPGTVGFAAHDWQNAGDSNVIYMFPGEFYATSLSTLTRTKLMETLGRAMSFFTVHEMAHSLGLDHVDAYGDSRITSASYTNTGGVETIDYMSGNDWSSFDPAPFLNAKTFTFSPLSQAKLAFSGGINLSPVRSYPEQGSAHNTPASAQPLELYDMALRGNHGLLATNIEAAQLTQLNELDVYSFTAKAGDLITAQTLASNVYVGPNTFDTVLKLKDASGDTIAQSDDIYFGPNVWGPNLGATKQDEDSMILNFIAPATGTYYIEVSTKSLTGMYDLFVAVGAADPFPWRNPGLTLDIDRDGHIAPVDALLIINELNLRARTGSRGEVPLPAIGANAPPPFLDPSGDNFVAPDDALLVINYLNSLSGNFGEGEGEANFDEVASESSNAALPIPFADDWLTDLATDVAKRRRRRLA